MCNGELGDKQTQEDADKQRSQWRQAQEVAIGTQMAVENRANKSELGTAIRATVMSQSEPKSTREAAEQALIACG